MGWYDNSAENQYRADFAGSFEDFGQLQAPHWYSGMLGAVPRGIAGATYKTASTYNDMLEIAGIDKSKWGVEEDKDWENYAKPDPRWQSATAQIAQGVTEGLGLAVAGSAVGGPLGGAVMVGGVEGHALYEDLRKGNVDKTTATVAAVASGAFNALGVLLPGTARPVAEWLMKMGAGATLAGKEGLGDALFTGAEKIVPLVGNAKGTMAFGVGTNVAAGIAQRGLTGEILRENGYDQMAEQFRALDVQSVAADVVLGAAFGGLAHYLEVSRDKKPNTVSQADIDAAMAVLKQEQFARGGPGLPATPLAANIHDEFFHTSIEDILLNRPLNIDPQKAKALADEVVADPTIDALHTAQRESVVDVHNVGDLLQTPVRLPPSTEPLPDVQVQQPQPQPKPAPQPKAEGAAPEMDFRMRETLNQLVSRNPDMELVIGDQKIRMGDLPAMLEKNLQDAQKDSALHDVAASCFIQTLGSFGG